MSGTEIYLTSDPKDQCVRWDCSRKPARPLEYCSVTCQEMASSDSKSTSPVLMPNGFPSTTNSKIATKILHLLKAGKNSGVPHLPQLVFQTPPWLSSVFGYNLSPRDEFCEWLFIGLSEIPDTVDFKWVGGDSKMIGGLSHRVLKPFPREDNRWKLHEFSAPDLIGKSVYVMRCNKLTS